MWNPKKIKLVKIRVKWWLPRDGGWGDKLTVVWGTDLQRVVNQPQRSNARYNKYRQQHCTTISKLVKRLKLNYANH